MLRGAVVSLFPIVLMSMLIVGCQKGRFTDDRHYVGDPERPAATSESTRDRNDTRRPTNADRY
jgi:hypothetical protein